MIKAVLFDYDGVLTLDKSGSYSICKYVSKSAGIDYELFSQEYKKYEDDLLLGKTTHEEIWGALCASINQEIGIRHLFGSFRNMPVNDRMFELVKNIKKNYRTALVADASKDRMDVLVQFQKLNDLFDSINVTSKVGSGKDREEIFKKAVKELNVSFAECVYIDNQEKNLQIPGKLGMSTIVYDQKEHDVKGLVSAMKELGLKI